MNKAIEKRQKKEKQLLLSQLRKTPIIEVACGITGIGRASYYRWRKDQKFAKDADGALMEGALLVNDIAESQLMSAIKEKNLSAIIFWLKHHHPRYATKVEVTAQLKANDEKLTPEQEALVTKALQLASLIPSSITPEKEKEKRPI